MYECANILKKQILEAAIEYANSWPQFMVAPLTIRPFPERTFKGLKPEDLDMADGKVFVKADPSKAVLLKCVTNRELVATYTAGLLFRLALRRRRKHA